MNYDDIFLLTKETIYSGATFGFLLGLFWLIFAYRRKK